MYLDYYRVFIDGTKGIQQSISQSVLDKKEFQIPEFNQDVRGQVLTPLRQKYLTEFTMLTGKILANHPQYSDIETHVFFPNTAGYGTEQLLDGNVLLEKPYPIARLDLNATSAGVLTGFDGDIDSSLRMTLMEWATWLPKDYRVNLYKRLIQDRFEWRHCEPRNHKGPTFLQMLKNGNLADFNCAPIAFKSSVLP